VMDGHTTLHKDDTHDRPIVSSQAQKEKKQEKKMV
jgi:hypothetical protein